MGPRAIEVESTPIPLPTPDLDDGPLRSQTPSRGFRRWQAGQTAMRGLWVIRRGQAIHFSASGVRDERPVKSGDVK